MACFVGQDDLAMVLPISTIMSRAKAIVLLAIFIGGCERGKVIRDEPVQLRQSPVQISMKGTGRSHGPTREICLRVSTKSADSIEAAIPQRGRYHSPLHAVLITEEGARDTLGRDTGPSVTRRDRQVLCLWDHGLSGPLSCWAYSWGRAKPSRRFSVRAAAFP